MITMKGLFLLGTLAITVGACCYAYHKSNNEKNLSSVKSADENNDIFEKVSKISANVNDCCNAFVTKEWLTNKAKQLLAKSNVQKIALIKLDYLLMTNLTISEALSEYLNDGYDYILVTLSCLNNIQSVEIIKNIGDPDSEIDKLLGSEKMIVIKE